MTALTTPPTIAPTEPTFAASVTVGDEVGNTHSESAKEEVGPNSHDSENGREAEKIMDGVNGSVGAPVKDGQKGQVAAIAPEMNSSEKLKEGDGTNPHDGRPASETPGP
jgi:hypothetical protein